MKTDYKFWYIRRNGSGFITECAIRFYEGNITTENEMDVSGNLIPVTRYRRSKKLEKVDLGYLGKRKFIKELSGTDVVIYTPDDFGQIKTDDELRLFLNNEIVKDTSRTVIDEQKELLDITKVK